MNDNATVQEQRRLLQEGALVQPMPQLGTLTISGSERQSWLNGMVTQNLAPLGPGDGAYALSVFKNGKILAELWIVIAPEHLYVGVLDRHIQHLYQNFDKYLIMEDAELQDTSTERNWLFVHGPKSNEAASVARSLGADAALVNWTDHAGACLVMPSDKAASIHSALLAQPDIQAVDPAAWDTLRIENYIPKDGVDFDDQNYPQEASLEDRAVSFNKGCYLGQETIFMLQMRGHAKKKLVQLEISATDPVDPGAEISSTDGLNVGNITSIGPSLKTSTLLALGYVKYKLAVMGTSLHVAGRSATVVRVRSALCA